MPLPDEGWRRRLRPASFRGAPFKVDVSGFITGRRTVTHEFPNRDVPYAEDMGRRARRFAIFAHIVGGDYDKDRDRLVQALEAGGPGTLVHPYYGSLQVNVDAPLNVTERAERGRMCEIEVTFVEAGEAATTAPSTNDASQAASAGQTASDANASTAAAQAASMQSLPAENNAGFGSVPSGGFLANGTSLGYGSIPAVGQS